MNDGSGVFVVMGLLALVLVVVFFLPRLKNRLAQLFIPLNSIRNSYDAILRQQSNYYNKLSPDEKDEFIRRAYFFLRGKTVLGVGGEVIGDTERVSIAAAAVQLTFGLEANRFPDFDMIVVHPDAYDSTVDHLSHRGDTSEDRRTIQFSWKYFTLGNTIADDGINLGLHEMAHALELEKMEIGTSFSGRFAEAYEKWKVSASYEMIAMRKTHKGFIRLYAATNLDEFFACCIEVFFEKAEAFKDALPDLYEKTCLMLRQDPARGVYRL